MSFYVHISIDEISGHELYNGEVSKVYDENGETTLSCKTITYEVKLISNATAYAVALANKLKKCPVEAEAKAAAKLASRYDFFATKEETETFPSILVQLEDKMDKLDEISSKLDKLLDERQRKWDLSKLILAAVAGGIAKSLFDYISNHISLVMK